MTRNRDLTMTKLIVYHHWNLLCSSQVKQVICVAHGVLCTYLINDRVTLVLSLSQDDTSFGSKSVSSCCFYSALSSAATKAIHYQECYILQMTM